MKLGQVIDVGVEKTVWATFKDEFEVCLRFLSRNDLRKLIEKATDRKIDRRAGQGVETLNPRKFDRGLAEAIVGWKGLTMATLSKIVPIKLGEGITPDTLIECDEEGKLLLLEHAYGFDKFIQDVCTDLETFNQEKHGEELKN